MFKFIRKLIDISYHKYELLKVEFYGKTVEEILKKHSNFEGKKRELETHQKALTEIVSHLYVKDYQAAALCLTEEIANNESSVSAILTALAEIQAESNPKAHGFIEKFSRLLDNQNAKLTGKDHE